MKGGFVPPSQASSSRPRAGGVRGCLVWGGCVALGVSFQPNPRFARDPASKSPSSPKARVLCDPCFGSTFRRQKHCESMVPHSSFCWEGCAVHQKLPAQGCVNTLSLDFYRQELPANVEARVLGKRRCNRWEQRFRQTWRFKHCRRHTRAKLDEGEVKAKAGARESCQAC